MYYSIMELKLSIHFKRKSNGSHLATAVMISGKTVRFFRTTLDVGVDPYAAYGDVAASAVNYLNAKGGTAPEPPPKEKPAGRLVSLRGVLPIKG